MRTASFFSNGGKAGNAVAICRGLPKGWTGKQFKPLAPTWSMLKLSEEEFLRAYQEQVLDRLDARTVYEALGDDAVLLCWEPFNVRCHRRLVAEWLESELGIEIPEFGRQREDSIPFAEQRRQTKAGKKAERVKAEKREAAKAMRAAKRAGMVQLTLF